MTQGSIEILRKITVGDGNEYALANGLWNKTDEHVWKFLIDTRESVVKLNVYVKTSLMNHEQQEVILMVTNENLN